VKLVQVKCRDREKYLSRHTVMSLKVDISKGGACQWRINTKSEKIKVNKIHFSLSINLFNHTVT